MGKYQFNKDIIFGEMGEQIVAQDLQKLGFNILNFNKNYLYDINTEIYGINYKFEVKTDEYCTPEKDTGNMFIELESRGKRSGLNTTEAHIFVYCYVKLGQIWYINVDRLKRLLWNEKMSVNLNCGDKGSNTVGVLLLRAKFIEHFKVRKI